MSSFIIVASCQDTDKSEVELVSEPEILHSCVLFCGLFGKLRAD